MQVVASVLAFCKRRVTVGTPREVMSGASDGWMRQTSDFHEFYVEGGHCGTANLRVAADSKTWLSFLARGRNFARAFLMLTIRLSDSPV